MKYVGMNLFSIACDSKQIFINACYQLSRLYMDCFHHMLKKDFRRFGFFSTNLEYGYGNKCHL